MQIKLLVIGKTDNTKINDLIQVYQKRLAHYIKFEIEVLPDVKNTKNISENEQKEKEGMMILNQISTQDYLVLLDENGNSLSSEKFANFIQKNMNSGLKTLYFAVGGPYGFSEKVYQRAQYKLSLSAMTFSHVMVRLFFVEQLYRAFTILNNEPYHHR
jgi:23S rRNA (pseudouridine1915-N3)-methyltransferase